MVKGGIKYNGAICGGAHQSRYWTRKEIMKHLDNTCIDCYCGIPFKKKKRKSHVIIYVRDRHGKKKRVTFIARR
jgi:hypothetical protein